MLSQVTHSLYDSTLVAHVDKYQRDSPLCANVCVLCLIPSPPGEAKPSLIILDSCLHWANMTKEILSPRVCDFAKNFHRNVTSLT